MIAVNSPPGTSVYLSVVIPVYNEEDNVQTLAAEILSALQGAEYTFEVIFVDDASDDRTVAVLELCQRDDSRIRVLRHRVNCGQSAAVATGFHASMGVWLATLDGDGQNDPADIPGMLSIAEKRGVDCVTGIRTRRQDSRLKKICSLVGNFSRNLITGDSIADSGCGVRVVRKDAIVETPVFNGMHRFLPTLLRAQGLRVVEESVNHRPRLHGVSKYGVHNRLWRGIRDCFAVRWYRRRAFPARRLLSETGTRMDAEQAEDGQSFPGQIRPKGISVNPLRLLILILCAAAVLTLHHFGPLQNPFLSVRNLLTGMESGPAVTGLAFFFLTFIMVALGVPRLIFFTLGGIIFSFWPGLLLAMAGTLAGAYTTFVFVRWCGLDRVKARYGDTAFFRNIVPGGASAKSVFFVRQLPLSCVFVNVALALSPVRTGAFISGSLLGFLPQGIVAALIGSGIAGEELREGFGKLLAAALLIFAIMFFSWQLRKIRQSSSAESV